MRYSLFTIAAVAGTVVGQQSRWGQCGGYGGKTSDCVSGNTCSSMNPYYWQCVPATAAGTASSAPHSTSASSVKSDASCTKTSSPASASPSTVKSAKPISTLKTTTKAVPTTTKAAYTSTKAASTSTKAAPTSSKAAPTSSKAAPTTSSATYITSKAAPTTTKAASTTVAKPSSTSTAQAAASGSVKYAGVNIAGLDFGCSTDGTCSVGGVSNIGEAASSQMNHFIKDTGLNAFRLPVGWQYLVNNQLGGNLDATNAGVYDQLMQNCLKSGAGLCIIDIHNYARWNGGIIGQGGPTNVQFTSLWSQLAKKYGSNSKVAFGIMNEPHDVPDVGKWADTVQAVVTAIRQAGATSNMILMPGNDWAHASLLVSDGSAAALNKVTNLDGSTANLVFDVHQYLDSDGSGTHTTCTTNNVDSFNTLADWLATNKRQAFLTETGGGPNDSSCLKALCEQLDAISKRSDVYLGWIGWAAGAFDPSYEISETPTGSAGSYKDQPLVTQCIAAKFKTG